MATVRTAQNLELTEPDKKERKNTSRALDKLTRLVTKHERDGFELIDMVSPKGPRVSAKMGEIKKEIYTTGAIHPQTHSPLVQLPNELLLRLHAHLAHRADQVSLALTCKQLACIDAAYRKRLTTAAGKAKTYTKSQKLEMLLRLRSWVPQKYSLCYQCLKFRARNRIGWTTNLKVSESGVANSRALVEGPKCPLCAEWLALQKGRETVAFMRAAERVKAMVRRS